MMSNPGNFGAAVQSLPNGAGFVSQVGHVTPPTGVVVIFNNAGTLSTKNSSGTVTPIGGGGGGGDALLTGGTIVAPQVFTGANNFRLIADDTTPSFRILNADGTLPFLTIKENATFPFYTTLDVSTLNNVLLPTGSSIGGSPLATLYGTQTFTGYNTFTLAQTFIGGITVLGAVDVEASTINGFFLPANTTIDGNTPATLEGAQTFSGVKTFDEIKGGTGIVGQATLSGGTVTVNTAKVAANSLIFVSVAGSTPRAVSAGSIVAATSFDIFGTGTDVVNWWIVNPA